MWHWCVFLSKRCQLRIGISPPSARCRMVLGIHTCKCRNWKDEGLSRSSAFLFCLTRGERVGAGDRYDVDEWLVVFVTIRKVGSREVLHFLLHGQSIVTIIFEGRKKNYFRILLSWNTSFHVYPSRMLHLQIDTYECVFFLLNEILLIIYNFVISKLTFFKSVKICMHHHF